MPKFPFINGLICALFITLGFGAVLDPTPQDVLPKLTGSGALTIAAGSQVLFHDPRAQLETARRIADPGGRRRRRDGWDLAGALGRCV